MSEKFKASIPFLRKVLNREVYADKSYTKRRGGYEEFHGGKATADAHIAAGLCRMEGGYHGLGMRKYVYLTDAGVDALESQS